MVLCLRLRQVVRVCQHLLRLKVSYQLNQYRATVPGLIIPHLRNTNLGTFIHQDISHIHTLRTILLRCTHNFHQMRRF